MGIGVEKCFQKEDHHHLTKGIYGFRKRLIDCLGLIHLILIIVGEVILRRRRRVGGESLALLLLILGPLGGVSTQRNLRLCLMSITRLVLNL